MTPWKGFKPLSAGEAKTLSGQVDGMVKELETTTEAARKAELVDKIGKAQSQLNASNPEAYLGGGTRIWVTERDAADLAAAGVQLETPLAMQQRVTSALTEGKFFDQAISTLRKPGANADEIAGALKDLGKHGERVTSVLKVEGKTSLRVARRARPALEGPGEAGEVGRADRAARERARRSRRRSPPRTRCSGSSRPSPRRRSRRWRPRRRRPTSPPSRLADLQFWTRFNVKLRRRGGLRLRRDGGVGGVDPHDAAGGRTDRARRSRRAAEQEPEGSRRRRRRTAAAMTRSISGVCAVRAGTRRCGSLCSASGRDLLEAVLDARVGEAGEHRLDVAVGDEVEAGYAARSPAARGRRRSARGR